MTQYLLAEKNRGSITIQSIRVFDSFDPLQRYVETLFSEAKQTKINKGRGYSGFYPNSWFVWEVSGIAPAKLSKKIMAALNLRNEDGSALSWHDHERLGI